jgi:hypothetical protein
VLRSSAGGDRGAAGSENALGIEVRAENDSNFVSQRTKSGRAVRRIGGDKFTVGLAEGGRTHALLLFSDANTTIRQQGKKISLSDVHTGDEVNVQGSRVDASTILAQTIEVHSSGHH